MYASAMVEALTTGEIKLCDNPKLASQMYLLDLALTQTMSIPLI